MSRSYLHDSWMRKVYDKLVQLKGKRNPHKFDEAPKNRASKDVATKCHSHEWLQEPANFSGHKIKKDGHTKVSGIVRAKTKREIKDEIEQGLVD